MTRRTTRRHYVLTPDEGGQVERMALYLLGYCCQKYGVKLHAICVMSTHLHYVVTDRGARFRCFSKSSIGSWPTA
ncbi:MAG: hypothetical protein AAF447_07110 [Myxococcota bacterium]